MNTKWNETIRNDERGDGGELLLDIWNKLGLSIGALALGLPSTTLIQYVQKKITRVKREVRKKRIRVKDVYS